MGLVPGRQPPNAVLAVLRAEVGYHCPVDVAGEVCGSPYLTWHHFDPPWRLEHHHRPEGMIALCREHADKADNGSFTDEQLRRFKAEGRGRGLSVSGRFDWMRRDLLAVVGGNAFLRTPVVLEVDGDKAIWFNRNENGELLLNFAMPSLSATPRASIRDNVWTVAPEGVAELICPPSGRRLRVRYANGDLFHAEFSSVSDAAELQQRLVDFRHLERLAVDYPLTVVELWEQAGGTGLQLTPDGTRVGTNQFKRQIVSNTPVGMVVNGAVPKRLALPPSFRAAASSSPHFREPDLT